MTWQIEGEGLCEDSCCRDDLSDGVEEFVLYLLELKNSVVFVEVEV